MLLIEAGSLFVEVVGLSENLKLDTLQGISIWGHDSIQAWYCVPLT